MTVPSPFSLETLHLRRSVVAAAVVVWTAGPALAGTIQGRVTLTEKGGQTGTDFSSIVVYLEGAPANQGAKKATITMRDKSFVPRVVAVPVGGTVEFPNADPILHNVFSLSKGNAFDLQLYKAPKTGTWSFRSPGVVNVYCNIHPQMSAFVLVRDNPYFTTVGGDGRFVIADVPAGRYTLRAWHDRGPEISREVTAAASGAVDVSVALDASGYKWVPHRNKLGRAYPQGENY